MNNTQTYFQPQCDGCLPENLHTFEAFESIESAEDWLDKFEDDPDEFELIEYHNEDIEGVVILDGDGDIIESNEGNEMEKVIAWCNDEDHDAYTPIDNLIMLMNEFLPAGEVKKIFKKIWKEIE